MKSNNRIAALSLTMGFGMLAGCGQAPASAPAATAPAAATAVTAPAANAGYTGPLSAAEGVTSNAATTTASASPAAAASASPATTASAAPSAAPSTASSASPSAMPSSGSGGNTISTGITSGGVGVGGVTGSGILGDTRVGGVSGSVSKGLDRGLGGFSFGAEDLVAFQSNRATGGGSGSDIFVYDARAQTVLALPAVNTDANESNPRLSSNAQWLVYQTDASGSTDIRAFDLRSQLIDTLRTLNTETHNESQPDISDDGNLIVYVSDESSGKTRGSSLRLYNTHNGANFEVPVANRGLTDITWPTISGNGQVIAYGASGGSPNRQIFVYSVRDAAQLTPPFLNDVNADQYNPDLNESGNHIAFVSNRRGSEDIYVTDLQSGFTDNLVLANTSATEQQPRFLGRADGRLVFQSNRTGEFRLYAYDMSTALLDTLPVANEIGKDSQLRNTTPSL